MKCLFLTGRRDKHGRIYRYRCHLCQRQVPAIGDLYSRKWAIIAVSAANYTDTNLKRYGKALPVEYLTSGILPFRLISEKDKSVIFCVVIREKFSKENLERLMNFVSDVS